jgi:hypothetical protein
MLAIPSALQSKFEERLRNESIPNNLKIWGHHTSFYQPFWSATLLRR